MRAPKQTLESIMAALIGYSGKRRICFFCFVISNIYRAVGYALVILSFKPRSHGTQAFGFSQWYNFLSRGHVGKV